MAARKILFPSIIIAVFICPIFIDEGKLEPVNRGHHAKYRLKIIFEHTGALRNVPKYFGLIMKITKMEL